MRPERTIEQRKNASLRAFSRIRGQSNVLSQNAHGAHRYVQLHLDVSANSLR